MLESDLLFFSIFYFLCFWLLFFELCLFEFNFAFLKSILKKLNNLIKTEEKKAIITVRIIIKIPIAEPGPAYAYAGKGIKKPNINKKNIFNLLCLNICQIYTFL